ncbi:MAG: outer membrane protein assembly factor BamB family protein [Planctomycetota bacterium]|jgi:outer membrane protein assembly factor BamB
MCPTNPFQHSKTITLLIAIAFLSCTLLSAPAIAASGDAAGQGRVFPDFPTRGLCVVLGGDRDLLVNIVPPTQLLFHVLEPEANTVGELKALAEQAGVGIDRIVIEQAGYHSLPYADNMVDIIVATNRAAEKLNGLSANEMLRVLRPKGIVLIIAKKDFDQEKLKKWARAGGIEDAVVSRNDFGTYLKLYKPPLEGVDDWTHWEHGPDNNPVSTDQVIKAPYMTQFLAEPYYIGMPAITTAAGGRTFLATGHIAHHIREWDMINMLIARNGYNGIELWRRPLPEGYLAHRSAFVATEDIFYMIDGDGCLMLDARTGAEKGKLRIPGVEGDWKWMVIDDGVVYVLAGDKGGRTKTIKGDRNFGGWSWADLSEGYYSKPRVPWGFGKTLAAYRLEDKRLLWKHDEDSLIDSRALAIRDKKLFLYCPDNHLRCIDSYNGEHIWTNSDKEVLGLIEQPGRGLTSTPGFRSSCMTVAGADALIIQGQTRMNVIAVAAENGKLLWQKKKITNNPNAIFVDKRAILGVGQGGNHVAIDPASGKVLDNLNFRKAACTRLTATPDSFFVRGEGTLRYDRASDKVLVDGAARPACNDGALPANGMLYLGPWACDCRLSLIGAIAKCSAGDFKFDHVATEDQRLELAPGDPQKVMTLKTAENDWPTYRANNHRTASTPARLARPDVPKDAPPAPAWTYIPNQPCIPTPPVLAGGLVFVAGDDGFVRAINAKTGGIRWSYATAGPIKMPPTIWQGRAYVGSGDGYVYALEAATGRLIWRFRAAPVERRIMVYGRLCSTWPVNTGVLVEDGVAYFAAGIIDTDGTYVYALDAGTGKIKWQNNSCGHLNAELRKGVSAQGNLTIHGDRLLMAGGNQISPARFDLATGKCLNQPPDHGWPKAGPGKFVGVLLEKYPIAGGRTIYASPENVANKNNFVVHAKRPMPLNMGGIPPAWNTAGIAMVNFRDASLACYDAEKAVERIEKGFPQTSDRRRSPWSALAGAFQSDGAMRWDSDMGEKKFEVVSIVLCPASLVAVAKYQNRGRAHPEWILTAFNARNGQPFWFYAGRNNPQFRPAQTARGGVGQTVISGCPANSHNCLERTC